jgi:hypothetical protein
MSAFPAALALPPGSALRDLARLVGHDTGEEEGGLLTIDLGGQVLGGQLEGGQDTRRSPRKETPLPKCSAP